MFLVPHNLVVRSAICIKNEKLCGENLEELINSTFNTKIIYNKNRIYITDKKYIVPDFKFIINNLDILVEMNGEQHYNEVKHFGGKEQLKIQKKRDKALRLYCKENNILLFEIDGRKYTGKKIKQYIIDEIIPKIKEFCNSKEPSEMSSLENK